MDNGKDQEPSAASQLWRADGQADSHEHLWRSIFDGALDAMLLADDQGRYLDANPAACELFGLAREGLLGQSIKAFAAPGADIDGAWQQFLCAGRMEGAFELWRPDGQRRELEFRATAHIMRGLHLSVLRDVTERKRSHEMQSRLAAIVESSDNAIISCNLTDEITSWNRGAECLYQWSTLEALGQPSALLVPLELRASERHMLARCMRGEPVAAFDTQRLRKDGSLVDVSLTVSAIRDANGQIIGISETARDLAERRKAEAQLRQAQKMEAIGVLAGGVAHDFNNLLSVILSYTNLVLDELAAHSPLRMDIVEIQRAGERATELTHQLLAFSRQQMMQPRVLDLNVVVQHMRKMLQRLLGEDIELVLHSAGELGHIHADLSQVEQIVMNLAVNARDAMPRGGTLTIETSNVTLESAVSVEDELQPGPYVLLAITDTGVGMDELTLARIFEPFFTTKEQGKGTGLGLSTVFGIVKQSEGHIAVHSKLGAGSRFEVYLPRTGHAIDRTTIRPAPPLTLHGTETILLVEDDEQVRVATRAILRRYGYHVLDAQNGGEAFLICEQSPGAIHLLLTDVVMPRLSGRQLAERLKTMRPDMRVLYVSGYTEDSIVHHGMLAEGIAFLHKPITPDALCRKIREVLSGRRDLA